MCWGGHWICLCIWNCIYIIIHDPGWVKGLTVHCCHSLRSGQVLAVYCLFSFTFGLYWNHGTPWYSLLYHFCRQFSLFLNWVSITATSPAATPTTATVMPIIVPTDSSITPEENIIISVILLKSQMNIIGFLILHTFRFVLKITTAVI